MIVEITLTCHIPQKKKFPYTATPQKEDSMPFDKMHEVSHLPTSQTYWSSFSFSLASSNFCLIVGLPRVSRLIVSPSASVLARRR